MLSAFRCYLGADEGHYRGRLNSCHSCYCSSEWRSSSSMHGSFAPWIFPLMEGTQPSCNHCG